MADSDSWQLQSCFTEVRSPWLTLWGERWRDDQGRLLDYWRVEKADSVIILPLQGNILHLPKPQFRPGLGVSTWDFPGGRLADEQDLLTTITQILGRELALEKTVIAQITPINEQGWPINSSFSNQRLYGVVAEIKPSIVLPAHHLGASYEATTSGLQALLKTLLCLQCRAVLLEWWQSRLLDS